MISVEEYTTHTLVIKKSEFVCHLIPCSQVEQAKALIEQYSDPQATHNCVAYIIGPYERAYDDGEPSGTAGMPMLNVLKMQGLSNIIAIVTRYFGGIKLGAGGLTRAYSQSVAQALKEANIVEKEPVDLYEIIIDYTYTRKFEHLLKMHHIKCIDIKYEEQVTYQCYIKQTDFFNHIQELTNNQFKTHKIGTDYMRKDV
ncbi:YigZ family protein [Allocoprobacillus halotolerans]|uniref:YigZ family protein n=1 Tax=Allocoprobacillus halotolerans TaxID=2944914 RepID=A0ABY5I5F8_9FIRM|nr:YigZ family protein [Allocoprobacillus halotolerans]UTY39933.1 YigZ family protein [Allocoprobacillus halotolerans]